VVATLLSVTGIRIPLQLYDAVHEDDRAERFAWLAALPDTVREIAMEWQLELEDPYAPGGQCAWVAPAHDPAGDELVLKVGWRHRESEHEAEGLLHWDGAGAVRCLRTATREDTTALLLERCVPGTQLGAATAEPEQDEVIATLLRRLWEQALPDDHGFGSLQNMCALWAEWFELDYAADPRGLDRGLAEQGIELLRELPRTHPRPGDVLLCTDLHAGNVLAARREPWLMIDPKPFAGDPAFDAVQHMLNCDERLATDPVGLAARMAHLLEVNAQRVTQWLFARCVQESLDDLSMREVARRLSSRIT
jgi:streptomycin 6-kinase